MEPGWEDKGLFKWVIPIELGTVTNDRTSQTQLVHVLFIYKVQFLKVTTCFGLLHWAIIMS